MENNQTNHSETSLPVNFHCDNWYENAGGSLAITLVQSILLDLLGGILSSAYLYQFYQGIEISHPLYAVLFSNITFSTVISFASFANILAMISGFMPCRVAMNLNGFGCFSVVLLNIVSWLAHRNASRVLSKQGGAEQLWLESQGTQPMTSGWLLIFRCRN